MDTMKAYAEKIGANEKRMEELMESAKAEVRAFTTEEETEWASLKSENENLIRTANAISTETIRRASEVEARAEETEERGVPAMAEVKDMEVRSGDQIMDAWMRGGEVRANEMTISSTGAIVPSEFSDDIIYKAVNLSGILQKITVVNSKGTYKQIVADNNTKISAGWTDEIAEITASDAKFTTIDIGHEKLAALSKVSLEAINQTEFDLVGEVKYQQSADIAAKLEEAVIRGTGTKQPYGLTTSGTAYTLASKTAITSDEIVEIFHKLAPAYHPDAAWLMSNDTLCKMRKLKDSDGQYLFHQSELTSGYVGTILGKPVMISDFIDDFGTSKKPILFGDFRRSYKANLNPDMTMQILEEKYAEYGMKGYLSIAYLGGRPVNQYAYVTVSCPAT